MNEIKIAIAGAARSGKSTVAKYLEDKYCMTSFAFADKLKEQFHEENTHIPITPKPRKGYQLFGEYKRYVHGEDYWINLCFDRVNLIRGVAARYGQGKFAYPFRPLITDLRYPNELERLTEEGYTTVCVIAPKHVRIERMDKEGDNYDESMFEAESEKHIPLLDVDFVINNSRTLEDLYKEIDHLMTNIIKQS
jgi:dephospho-CoA kinase